MPIDGLVSGLDTATIIKKLMDVERIPQNQMKARRNMAEATLESLGTMRANTRAVSTAAAALSTPTDWSVRSATSSNPAVAGVTVTGTPSAGAFGFVVEQLAAAHSLRSGNTVANTTSTVASGGTISFDRLDGSGPTTINVGSGSLSEVVSAVNGANLGVRANAVNTGSGFRLQVTSTSSGANSDFSLSGLDVTVGGMGVLVQGKDARIRLGEGAGSYTITSSTNRFEGVIAGLTIEPKSVSADPVTITVAEDAPAVAAKVQSLVAALNTAIDGITAATKYDPATRKGSPLTGDPSVRRLASALRNSVTDAVGQSALGSAGFAGVTLGRDGRFTFDQAKFTKAYEENPAAVQRLFVRGATTTGSVTFQSAGPRAAAGTYDVVVTAAATAGTAAAAPPAVGTELKVRVGTTLASVTVGAGETATDLAARLQTQLDAQGIGVRATEDAGQIRLTATATGSTTGFEVAWDGTSFSSHAGTDVAGTIGGEPAIGRGNQLAVLSTNDRLGGLTVSVSPGATGSIGTISYEAGLAGRLTTAALRATDPVGGYLTGAEATRTTRISSLTNSIDAYELRLTKRETALKLQFTNLESSLSTLRNQSNWLASQVGRLSSNND